MALGVAGLVASTSDMAGCRKRLAGAFEDDSTLEHESKCVKVHRMVSSLSPMKDNSFGGVVVGFAFVFSIVHQGGSERCLSNQMAK